MSHRHQWFGGETFAQHGDDLVLLNIFHRLGIATPSYLDIGAHHPTELSNTALLYARGSRGINVEANPHLIAAFHEQRPDDINLNVGVDVTPGSATFYLSGLRNGRNSFVREAVDEIGIDGDLFLPVTTVSDIVDKHANGIFPDLLSIDIEGLDAAVLASINYKKSSPKVICSEVFVGTQNNIEEIRAILQPVGFAPCFVAGSNMIFLRNDLRLW